MYKIKVMSILTFLTVTAIVLLLSLIVIKYWEFLLFLGLALTIILGIIASAWITAFILTFFNMFLVEKWEGFHTRWLYSGIFFTAGTVIYMFIAYDILNYAVNFVKNLFRGR